MEVAEDLKMIQKAAGPGLQKNLRCSGTNLCLRLLEKTESV